MLVFFSDKWSKIINKASLLNTEKERKANSWRKNAKVKKLYKERLERFF